MIALHTHFPNFQLQPQRLIFVNDLRKSSGSLEAVESFDVYCAGLAYRALNAYLGKNEEIRKFVERKDRRLMIIPSDEDIYELILERLIDFIWTKKRDGKEVSKEHLQDIADLIAETTCRVAYLETMRDVDSLTELPNRRAFDIRLDEEIRRSGRSGPLSFLIFDLDKFKEVNDTYGHQAGDQALRDVADCFRAKEGNRILRDSDFVARVGGDEFYILLPNTDAEGACIAAHRISESINSKKLEVGEGGNSSIIQLGSSIGVGQFNGIENDADGKKMISSADECLYIMKGMKPDKNGLIQERRGHIAYNGLIISSEEIADMIKKKQGTEKQYKRVSTKEIIA